MNTVEVALLIQAMKMYSSRSAGLQVRKDVYQIFI